MAKGGSVMKALPGDLFLEITITAFILWNIYVYLNMYSDKRRSQNGHWRIPETSLLLKGFFFGAVGLYAGMKVFHHKTRHLKFVAGAPLLIFVNLLEIVFLYYMYVRLSARFI
jgi:uncharacterized membrane protein YsdA (DUF1294 family)